MPSFSFRSLFAVWFLLQSVCPAAVWGQATNTPSKKTLSKEEKAALLQKYGPVPVANQYPLINTSREQMDFSQGGALQQDSLHLRQAGRLMKNASSAEEYQTALVWRHNALNSMGRRKSAQNMRQSWDNLLVALAQTEDRADQAISQAQGYSDHFLSVDLENLRRTQKNILDRRPVWKAQADRGDKNTVLQRWSKADLTEGDLVEYIDPMNPENFANFYDTIYAAEILANTIDGYRIIGFSQKETSLREDWLMRTQQRVLYRYTTFQSANLDIPALTRIQMKGTLRLLLLKIHLLYRQYGWEDPLSKPYNERNFSRSNRALCSAANVQQQVKRDLKRHFQDGPSIQMFAVPADPSSQVTAPKAMGWSPTLYADFLQEYVQELSQYKNQLDASRGVIEPWLGDGFLYSMETLGKMAFGDVEQDAKQAAALMMQAQLTAQYAGTYAVIYGDGMDSLIRLFEDGSSPVEKLAQSKDQFERFFAPLQNALLTAFYETAQYSLNDSWEKVYGLFKKYANPKGGYSFPVRVFALEMLSLMAQDGNFTQSLPKDSQEKRLLVYNSRPLPEADREQLAQWAVDMYAPLTQSYRYNDHGLNTEKLQVLASELVRIHARLTGNGSQNKEGEFVLSPAYFQGYIGTPQKAPSVGLKTRTSSGQEVYLNGNTPENYQKQMDDYVSSAVSTVMDLALWVYGGRGVAKLVTIAGRYTKGAIVSMPRAVKMFSAAKSGRKLKSAAAVMNRQFRFQKEAGAAVRKMDATTFFKNTSAGTEEIGSVSQLSTPLSKSREVSTLLNEGKALPQETISFTQWQPGFNSVYGTSGYTGRVNASNWTRFKNSFRNAQGARVTWQPLNSAQRRVVKWEQRGMEAINQLGREKAFDLYIPSKTLSSAEDIVFRPLSGAREHVVFPKEEIPALAFIGPKNMFGTLDMAVPYQKWVAKTGFEPLFLNPNTLPSSLYPVTSIKDLQAVLLNNWQFNYAKHAVSTGAVDLFAGRLLRQTSLGKIITSNAKWIGGLVGADLVAYYNPIYNYKEWQDETTLRQYTQALKEEGLPLAKEEEKEPSKQEPVLSDYSTIHPSLQDSVTASGNETSQGASLLAVREIYKQLTEPDRSLVGEADRMKMRQQKHDISLNNSLTAHSDTLDERFEQAKQQSVENFQSSIRNIKKSIANLRRIFPDKEAHLIIDREISSNYVRTLQVLRQKVKTATLDQYVALNEQANAVVNDFNTKYTQLQTELFSDMQRFPKTMERSFWLNRMSRLAFYSQSEKYGPQVTKTAEEWVAFVDKEFENTEESVEEASRFLQINWEMKYAILPHIQRAQLLADYSDQADQLVLDFGNTPEIWKMTEEFKKDLAHMLGGEEMPSSDEIKQKWAALERVVVAAHNGL